LDAVACVIGPHMIAADPPYKRLGPTQWQPGPAVAKGVALCRESLERTGKHRQLVDIAPPKATDSFDLSPTSAGFISPRCAR
jgi:hypothetical protein